MSRAELPDALYYLRNFRQAIAWVVERNHDLLSEDERAFAVQLDELPIFAQALLARLSMRRGDLFRHSKINYAEIEPLSDALDALKAIGWLDARPQLSLAEVFRLATRAELARALGDRIERSTKAAAYEALIDEHARRCSFEDWLDTEEAVYRVTIASIVLQFRLLHFGNFHQAWHEYTLAHLQIFKYEPVPLNPASRPFASREEIEFFYALYGCDEAMSEGAALPELLARLPRVPPAHGWLRRAWDRLRFELGRAAEREEDPDTALALYRNNAQIDARVREVRLLECLNRDEESLATARVLLAGGGSERLVERVNRIVSRLERRRGTTPVKAVMEPTWTTTTLSLVQDRQRRVEVLVQAHWSSEEAPVYYVENNLLCSLFGLLCWEALFQPVRGAFFHPFQSAPADLHCADFVARRRDAFDTCLSRLDTGEYAQVILRTFADKHGTNAPFVHWFALDAPTLKLALDCIPVGHLKLYFARMLEDVSENSSGFPDLVQFFVRLGRIASSR